MPAGRWRCFSSLWGAGSDVAGRAGLGSLVAAVVWGLLVCFGIRFAVVLLGLVAVFAGRGGWLCQSPAFLAVGLAGLVAVLGGCPPILAGGFGCRSLICMAGVRCWLCCVGVLVVVVRGLVVACGVLLCGGLFPSGVGVLAGAAVAGCWSG